MYRAILRKITPTSTERKTLEKVAKQFMVKVEEGLKDATLVLGGSAARDTWLAGSHDIDVFVLFDFKIFKDKSAQLSDVLEKNLKAVFPKTQIARVHGSRDYFQLKYKDFEFEIIPILGIKDAQDARNITDVSVLHTIWVNKNTVKLKDEIRLAKQFLKAQKLYGAESYIGGFSGYMVEILVAYYGGFEAFLRAAAKWKKKEIIDPAKHYRKNMVLFHLNKSKTNSPVVVVDPVDKSRNAAAALSATKVKQFQKVAREYLKSPSDASFVREEITFEKVQKKNAGRALVFCKVVPLHGKKDVVGAKIRKVFTFLKGKLKEFGVSKSDWDWKQGGDAVLYFVLKKKELSEFEVRMGPPVDKKEFVQDFKRKNNNTFIEAGRVMAKVRREHTDLKDFTRHVLKDEYLKERVQKITLN